MAERIKKEPEDPVEIQDADEVNSMSPKSLSGFELMQAMYESIKDAASVNTKLNKIPKQEMDKKRKNDETDEDDDYPRSDMCPDRTMSDFYCNICDAHMNSEQMWESHISGKRHLKNVKKEPGEMPSKVKAIKVQASPKLMDAIKNVHEPLVGLGFMTELQRYDSCLNPSYTCHLCQANCTWSVVIDHILGTKHRLAYLKAVDPNEYEIIENMELKKISLDQLAEDRAREYERKRGCGTMEVKLEKPKVAPPPPRIKMEEELSVGRHSRSLSSESRYRRPATPEDARRRRSRSRSPVRSYTSPVHRHRKRHASPVDGKWRHDRYSPESPCSRTPSTSGLPPAPSMELGEKINFLRKLAQEIIVVSDVEVKQVKTVIAALTKSILQYKIRQMPLRAQNRLAKLLAQGDTENFEKELVPTLEFVYDAVSNLSSSNNHHRRHRRSSSSSSKKRY